MADSIPTETIQAFARTICVEAAKYGFQQIDIIRLINEIMDVSLDVTFGRQNVIPKSQKENLSLQVKTFPLQSDRLVIRPADPTSDTQLFKSWMEDQYGRQFLLSCATAQPMDLDTLLSNPQNEVGIVAEIGGEPIGAVAYLDIDPGQRRAELRKLIGVPDARGKGYAEEATLLWIQYGGAILGLEKIYVSTLQTHLRNIQLNESIGFKVEGLLQREVLIAGDRHDVLRMGLCFDELPNSVTASDSESLSSDRLT